MCAKKKILLDGTKPEYPFRLLAISSHLNLNRMLWKLNTEIELNLSKDIDYGMICGFPIFIDRNTLAPDVISLIPNKQSDGSKLIKQLPNIEYIIELSGNAFTHKFTQIATSIKQIEGIQALFEIQPNAIKRQYPFFIE